MALYDLIFNFYITYIFNTDSHLGLFMVDLSVFDYGAVDMGTYLSVTMTIITLVLICIMLIKLLIWLFSLFGNLLGGR